MSLRSFKMGLFVSIALANLSHAHSGAFHEAMYCINGSDPSVVNRNSNAACLPLYNLPFSDAWMHHTDKCDEYPPEPGKFLELPAGGQFTVELADNRASTSLNPEAILTQWGDGNDYPDDYHGTYGRCITKPNLHTQNQTMAAGTAFAISYESDIKKVTLDNLVVFTVLPNTPWKRVATYDVPSGMPACPDEGCICTFVWIPNGCGISNMYMFPYKCKVIPDSTTPKTLAHPKAPVWCEEDQNTCVQGAKQIIIWHQLDGNNIEVTGYDMHRSPKSPGYNTKCGFHPGAQNDIFVESDAGSGSVPETSAASATSTSPSPSCTGSLPTHSAAPSRCSSGSHARRARARRAKARREMHVAV